MGRKKKQQRAPRGMGSFRQRSCGTIEYRVTVYDEYGKAHRKAFSGKTETECLERYEQYKIDEERRRRGIKIDATIPWLVEAHYRNDLETNYTNEQGFSRGMETLKIIKRSGIGCIPIAMVTKFQLKQFLCSITRYSNSTIEKVYNQLKKAYRDAVNDGIITHNLMLDADIRRPRSSKQDKKVRGYTTAEQKRFVDTLNAHKIPYGRNNYKRQLLIELYTGMRMGEINALKPEDIDFDRKVISVRRTISSGKGKRPFINTTTKTYAGLREVPFIDNAEMVLREALDAMQPNPEGLIFYDHKKNGLLTTNQVNCFFQRICEKAGIEYNGQHALRHTFATRCIESGISAFVLKKWMGHTDIHVTLDTYADVFDSLNHKSMNMLQEYSDTII